MRIQWAAGGGAGVCVRAHTRVRACACVSWREILGVIPEVPSTFSFWRQDLSPEPAHQLF